MVFDHSTGKWFIVKTSTGSIFAIIEFQCFCFFITDSMQVQNIMSFLNWWNKIRFQNYRYFFCIDIQVNLYFNVVNERVEQKKLHPVWIVFARGATSQISKSSEQIIIWHVVQLPFFLALQLHAILVCTILPNKSTERKKELFLILPSLNLM